MTEVQEKQRQNIKFGYILSNTETVWILQWKSTVRGKLSFFEEEQCREDFASEFLHRGKNLQKTSIIKNQNYKQSSMSCKRVNQTVVERQIFEPHDLKDWVRLLRQQALPFILNTHHLVDSKYPDRTACSRYLSKKRLLLTKKEDIFLFTKVHKMLVYYKSKKSTQGLVERVVTWTRTFHSFSFSLTKSHCCWLSPCLTWSTWQHNRSHALC